MAYETLKLWQLYEIKLNTKLIDFSPFNTMVQFCGLA